MFMHGSASTEVPMSSVHLVEENTIHYAAGYVVRKELKKYRKAIKELHWNVLLSQDAWHTCARMMMLKRSGVTMN